MVSQREVMRLLSFDRNRRAIFGEAADGITQRARRD